MSLLLLPHSHPDPSWLIKSVWNKHASEVCSQSCTVWTDHCICVMCSVTLNKAWCVQTDIVFNDFALVKVCFNRHVICVISSCRNTPSMYSSVKAGKMRDFALKVRWRCFPWITSWPVTSGLRTPSSSMGRNPSHTIWRHRTSCCGWKTMGRCCTPWGRPAHGSPGIIVTAAP